MGSPFFKNKVGENVNIAYTPLQLTHGCVFKKLCKIFRAVVQFRERVGQSDHIVLGASQWIVGEEFNWGVSSNFGDGGEILLGVCDIGNQRNTQDEILTASLQIFDISKDCVIVDAGIFLVFFRISQLDILHNVVKMGNYPLINSRSGIAAGLDGFMNISQRFSQRTDKFMLQHGFTTGNTNTTPCYPEEIGIFQKDAGQLLVVNNPARNTQTVVWANADTSAKGLTLRMGTGNSALIAVGTHGSFVSS